MLFTLGLFLLLTPFPSFQTPTSEKRDSIGSEGTKANAVLSLLKPKTTSAPTKQTIRSALKPNTLNETVLPSPTTTPNPSVTSTLGTAKSKPSPLVIQTTPTAVIKAAPATSEFNKDKHTASVNPTVSVKPHIAGESKATKDKPAPTGTPNVQQTAEKPSSTSSVKNTKENKQPSVNKSVSVKSPSSSDTKHTTEKNVKPNKNRPQPSVNQNATTSDETKDKSASTGNSAVLSAKSVLTKQSKDRLQPSSNVTKPAAIPVQNVQATSAKFGSDSGAKTSKNKPTTNVSSKDKAASTATVKSTPTKAPTTTERRKASSSTNQTIVIKTPRPGPAPEQSIKVVIVDGCEPSGNNKEELELKPGAPLVMTHKISLVPSSCTGGCEAKMAALEGRVARLEKEMSYLKEKCPCSASCPNECSGNGECEKGKCICHQGFMGPDCKKVTKDKAKVFVEMVSKKDSGAKNTIQTTKAEQTLFHKKEQMKGQGAKETDVGSGKTSVSKTTTKTSATTVGQLLLNNKGIKQEEARTGKPTVLAPKKTQTTDPKLGKEDSTGKAGPKSDRLKDGPHANVTQITTKRINGTAKIVTETSKTRPEKGATEQSTMTEKTTTQQHKKVKVDGQSVATKSTDDGKTGKGDVSQRSQYIVNLTTADGSEHTLFQQNKTVSVLGSSSKRAGGSGLGLVKVVNVSSYSFILTWTAPQGMFKNFTVIRREPRVEGDETEELEEEEVLERDKTLSVKNTTEIQVQSEVTVNATSLSGKVTTTRVKAEGRRITMVVPGNTRSVEFSNLRLNTQYVLQIYGATAERRSRIHRVTATTGPEPVTEVVFSNMTESSFALSWNKPKTAFTGYRITYINIVTGASHSVTVGSEHSTLVLSKLSPGTSYIVSVTTTQGRVQGDAHTSLITTVPAPPVHLRAVNVSDTRAVLKWTPSLGKVDRFVVSYESSKSPNVTVSVMLSGNTVEHQLRGLQRGTLYTVKVLSQKDSLQSNMISTTFTTANAVKASEVGARHAVITWKHSASYQSYRITYQVVGEETKEIILDSTVTEYKLTGLLPMSRYMVLVQGERDGHYTSLVTSEFITGKLRFPFPTECSQELLNGALQSGEVDVYPQGRDGQVVRVYCDMETDGGGWTVFQRRTNGKTDFYRTWSEYSSGFGNISEEFWIGNKLLHNLTSIGPVSLRVDMRSGNDSAYAHYANFSIDSEEKHYALTVSGYTGTAGDSMRYHNGRPFSARDKDPDSLGIHCARAYMGGWWYKNCYKTNLNGLYGINSNNQGIVWIDWKGKDSSIPFTEMKFRPSRFSPATHG